MKKFILFFFILLFSTSVLSDNIYIFGNIGISDFQIDNDDKTDINTKLTDFFNNDEVIILIIFHMN